MNRAARKYCLAWGIPPTFFHPRHVSTYDRLWWKVMCVLHPRKTTPKTSMGYAALGGEIATDG